jgi:hypothetical protein
MHNSINDTTPTPTFQGLPHLIGLAYQGKDIVFTFIIKFSSLRDFGS